jgi:hypothetical protein
MRAVMVRLKIKFKIKAGLTDDRTEHPRATFHAHTITASAYASTAGRQLLRAAAMIHLPP